MTELLNGRKVNVSMPYNQYVAVREYAQENHMTFSGVIQLCIKETLHLVPPETFEYEGHTYVLKDKQ